MYKKFLLAFALTITLCGCGYDIKSDIEPTQYVPIEHTDRPVLLLDDVTVSYTTLRQVFDKCEDITFLIRNVDSDDYTVIGVSPADCDDSVHYKPSDTVNLSDYDLSNRVNYTNVMEAYTVHDKFHCTLLRNVDDDITAVKVDCVKKGDDAVG